MRYFKILLLHVQDVLQERTRAFVFFLINIVNPLMLILFWGGVKSNSAIIGGFTRSELNSYYLILIVVLTIVISHIETDIAREHIREGTLVSHLVRPFPYLTYEFLREVPHRLLQAIYGMVIFVILQSFIPDVQFPILTLTTLFIVANAYVLCFIVQATISLLAFWITDMSGALNTWEVIRVLFAGNLVPLTFLPEWVSSIAYTSPFAYIVYFPVIALLGKTNQHLEVWIIFMQFLWMALFVMLYKTLWHFGLRRFNGVGQ